MKHINSFNENNIHSLNSTKYAIEHLPSGKYVYDDSIKASLIGKEDFGSTFLDDEPTMVFSSKEEAEYYFQMFGGSISFEDDSVFPIDQFKIVEIN